MKKKGHKCKWCGKPIKIIPKEIVVPVNYQFSDDGMVMYDYEYMNEQFQDAVEHLPYANKEDR
jgi:hypothetical protein